MTTKKPHILITNDDGIHARGIWHLWNSLKDHAELSVIAPAYEQSAVGLAITIRDPLRLHQVQWPGNTTVQSITGTPADCVKLGVSMLLENKPDLVVSGINRGSNAGRNVLYSGTVAGAIEGTLQDIPSIAFSCVDYDEPHYHLAEEHIPTMIDYFLHNPPPHGTFINVNFPTKSFDTYTGFKMTRQGKQYWIEDPDQRSHPGQSEPYIWLGAKVAQFDEEEDCDISWLDKGYITAVPIHIGELTDHEHISRSSQQFEELFAKETSNIH